jgi:hypothetical protein
MVQSIHHRRIVNSIISHLEGDARFLGLAARGTWLTGDLDEFSGLDLLLLTDPGRRQSAFDDRVKLAESFGPLLSFFPADHGGNPNLQLALYDEPLLHVGFTFLGLDELRTRTENPAVLWERSGAVTRVLEESKPSTPHFDLQWVEDRFWSWLQYGAQRLGGGELFSVLSTLDLLRSHALGPMESVRAGKTPHRVRRLERLGEESGLAELRSTVATYDARSCEQALKAAAKMYVGLRETLDKGSLKRNRRAEMASLRYLHGISEKI